jgi:uncharacterized protein (TIRG00374 family)
LKKKIGKWLSIVLPLVLGIYLINYKYNEFSPEQLFEIKGYFKNANYFYINLSLFIALFGFLSRAYRWKYAIEHLGYQTHFYNNLMAVCVGYFINLTIPRSGEFSRALVLKRYENLPFDKGFGTIVAERVVDSIIFLFFIFASLLFQFNTLKEYILAKIPVQNLIILGVIGALSLLFFLLVWLYSKWKIVLLVKEKLSGLIEGMSSILKMKKKWQFLFHSLFIWFTYILMFYVTIFALKETSTISFGAVTIAFIFGTLAVGFTNGGFGVYPLIIAEIFMLYGVSDTAGTAFGWLAWASQTILMVVLGGLSFLFLPILNRK